tara:strand:- start:309 stop:500 length:192 start_codon:yes stop_codon:yes gene_type:complete
MFALLQKYHTPPADDSVHVLFSFWICQGTEQEQKKKTDIYSDKRIYPNVNNVNPAPARIAPRG